MKQVTGGVCAPKGFYAAGIHAGIRKNPAKKDLALIYSKTPCVSAGVTTQNLTCAAPVLVTRDHLQTGTAQAIICNSGNANACTTNGLEVANAMCQLVADELGISAETILVGSTGVIGQPMDIAPIANNIKKLVAELSADGSDACASAIMTTDLAKKEAAVTFTLAGKAVTVGGICKGSGMIHPNMATMLGFVTTDVSISPALLQKAVKEATALSFNMVSVDGDTSTNDMVLVLANGLAGNATITAENDDYALFYTALLEVFTTLAISIAADGEGASKLITSRVTGGTDQEATVMLAKSVITSNLVKAAMFGNDANWGRILCAMGNSGALFAVDQVSISFVSSAGRILVCEHGENVVFDEEKAFEILTTDAITIAITIGNGSHQATAWGCDLTYDYVKINGDYRS